MIRHLFLVLLTAGPASAQTAIGAAVRSIPSKRAKPRRPVRKPSASPMPGTRPTPTQRHQFLTETKSARMLGRPIPDSPEKLNPSRRLDRDGE